MSTQTILRSFLLLSIILIGWGSSIQAQTLTFSLGNITDIPGSTVIVPVSVSNFSSINAYQGTMVFDTTALSFQQISSPLGVPPNLLINVVGNPGQGIIPLNAATFLWTDFFGGTVTLPGGSVVMNIHFTIKSTALSGTYPIIINGSTTTLGYSDNPNGTGLLMPVINSGGVTVSPCLPTGDAGFSFPSSVCVNGINPTATITGDAGGTFSVNNGATINPTTGQLSLASTTSGNSYTVTYDLGGACGATSTQTIIINPLDDASFTFPTMICVNEPSPSPVITGLSGGVFSVNNGASINPATGMLSLPSLVAGSSYTITYTTNGSCPNSFAKNVMVQEADDANFSYPATVCVNGSDPLPIITGIAGGIFTVDLGAIIDPISGLIDAGSLTAGTTYTITYQTGGPCPDFSTSQITVQDTGNAAFAYPLTVCPSGPNPVATITGDLGGSFSVLPAASINAATGELDLSSTTTGTTYSITYSLSGICPTSSVQIMTVEDTEAPLVPLLSPVFGSCNVLVPTPGTTDNCVGTVMGTTSDPLSYSVQGTYTLTWSFDDGNGNVSTATQLVLVNDTMAPVVICKNITIQLDISGTAVITPIQLDNGTLDNCGLQSLALSQDTFTLSDVGGNAVTLIATDVNGNVDSCVATVTVVDYQAPFAVCQDITLFLDTGGNAILSPIELDNGSTVFVGTPLLTVSQDAFGCGELGANEVTLYVADGNGVMDSCTATVMVVDTVAPKVQTQDITIYLDSMGMANIVPVDIDLGSSDACGILSYSLDLLSFSCADAGTNQVLLTVTDMNGNSAIGDAFVTVIDSISPLVTCQDLIVKLDSNGIATITVMDIEGGSSDECGIAAKSVFPNTFTIADLGINLVTLTVTDENGNSSSCMANVTVEEFSTSLFRPLEGLSHISLELFPNPADHLLSFRWGSDTYGELSVSIVDQMGKTVLSSIYHKGKSPLESQLDVQQLASGVYLLRVQQGAEVQVARFVRR